MFATPALARRQWHPFFVDSASNQATALVKFRFQLQQHAIDIDVFLAESPYQQELISRRRAADVEGNRFWLVSPEDLVLLKLVANRPRDLADIADVLFTQGQLDVDYLRRWAAELHVAERLENVLRNHQT